MPLVDALRYAWTRNYLSHFTQLYLVLLVILGIYEVYFVLVVLTRLRTPRTARDASSPMQNLARLSHRSANLQQMILAMLYLFGMTFFIQIGAAYFTPDNNRPVGPMVLQNLEVYFAFAAFVYLMLFVLHLLQWFLSARIQRAAAGRASHSLTV